MQRTAKILAKIRAARAARLFMFFLTNDIIALWRCRSRSRRRFLNFLLPNFYAVMAAKRFQTRTEKGMEQFLRDKNSKSTNKICDLFYMQIDGICNILQ